MSAQIEPIETMAAELHRLPGIRASQEMAGQGWCQVLLTTTPRGLHRTWREGDFQRGPPAREGRPWGMGLGGGH